MRLRHGIPMAAIAVVSLAAGCGGGDETAISSAPSTAAATTTIAQATTSSVPSACASELADAAASVLRGEGMVGVGDYSGEAPHPVALIQSDGRAHPLCVSVPTAWSPEQVTDLQLVALIADPASVVIERCPYSGAPDVVRFRYEVEVELSEAATGLTLATTTLAGPPPRLCAATEPMTLTRLDGEPISDDQIVDWLRWFVETNADSEWIRVPHDEAVFATADRLGMRSVVAGGTGLVAVGHEGYDNDGVAAVWTSVDGLEWSRVAHLEIVFGGRAVRMRSVVAGGPGLVAVGRADGEAAVWTSVDGLAWSRVPHDEAVFGGAGDQEMNSVVVGGPGLVSVGTDGTNAAVWFSEDGIGWSRIPHREDVFGFAEFQSMNSVAVGGPGLVAVGVSVSGQRLVAAAWTSADGLEWSPVTNNQAFVGASDQMMLSVTEGGPGLVAVGYDAGQGDGGAGVWTSPDGLAWTRLARDESVFGGPEDQAMNSVVGGETGFVAVGEDGDFAAVWTSVDGLVWTRVPHQDGVFGGEGSQVMESVAATGTGLVAVGSERQGREAAAVWMSPAPAAP